MVKQTAFTVFFSIFFFSILFFSSCKTEKKVHYVVKTPANWVREDGLSSEGSKRSKFTPKEGDTVFYSGESIMITGFQFKNIDEYVRMLCKEVEKNAVFYQEKKREKLKVNGFEARWVQLQLSFPEYPKAIVEQKTYFIQSRRIVFMIVCTAQKDQIENLQPIIDEFLASFKTEEDK
jgi:hypothetical protein